MKKLIDKKWWKEAVVYQIYPRSYKDTTGSGIGDINGITLKLDYIKSLGIDVIWLNPVYESPCADMGYDISDYRNTLKDFGTLADMESLIDEAHKRDIKIVMDLVINHTSNEHKWFMEARKSVDNKYHDYYIFRKGKNGNPPNNWESIFGGSAWEYNQLTDEYYLNLFTPEQPDLNWENPDVREEVKDIMRFWLDKGIDGFRMDAIAFISKKTGFSDLDKKLTLDENYANGPRLHEFLKELNRDVLSQYDCMTVGECGGTDISKALELVGHDRDELQSIIHWEAMLTDVGPNGEYFYKAKLTLSDFKKVFTKWHKALYGKGWNSIYLMNHDQPRTVSRFGNDKEFWKESAKMLATFQLSMCGTPYIYQGEEIGMTNCHFEPEEFRDVWAINYYNEMIKKGYSKEDLLPGILYKGRDNSRTPIQWDNSKNGGFSASNETWIKVNPNHSSINVEKQSNDPDSILSYFRKLIRIRKTNDTLIYGDYEIIDPGNEDLYVYKRILEKSKLLIILNFKEYECKFDKVDGLKDKKIIISNYADTKFDQNTIVLRPYEAIIFELS